MYSHGFFFVNSVRSFEKQCHHHGQTVPGKFQWEPWESHNLIPLKQQQTENICIPVLGSSWHALSLKLLFITSRWLRMEPQINCEVVYLETILTPKVACCLPSVFEVTLKICKYPQDPSSISFFFRQTHFHDQTDTVQFPHFWNVSCFM